MIPDKLKNILKDADLKEILSKGFTHLAVQLGGTFMGFLFTIFITQEFGEDDYGLIVWSFSVFLMLSVFGRLGLDINVLKFFALPQNDTDSGIFYRSILKSFVFSGLIAGFFYWQSESLIHLFPDPKPQVIPFLRWALLAVPFWSVALISANFLRAKKRNFAYAFYNNPARFFFSLLLVFLLFQFNKDSLIAMKAHFYAIVLISCISFALVSLQLKNVKFSSTTNSWRFLKEGFPMMLSSSVIVFLGWTDTLVMGIYESDAATGIYAVCVKIAALTTFVMYAVSSILAPKIALAYADGDLVTFNKMVRFSTLINVASTLLTILGILVLNQFLLGLFGEAFKEGVWILVLLCIGQFVSAYFGSVGVVMQMIGKQKVYQNIVVVALGVNLLLNFSLVPFYGGIGAAIATIFSTFVSAMVPSIYMKIQLNITTYVQPFEFKALLSRLLNKKNND